MALSKKAVEKAWYILNEINPKANNSFICKHDETDPFKENTIIGLGKKEDGGWENVFINVKDITIGQIEKFKKRRKEIPNTYFCKENIAEGITRLGWL